MVGSISWMAKALLVAGGAVTAFAVGVCGASPVQAADFDHSQGISFTSVEGNPTNCTVYWGQDYDATNLQLYVYLYVEHDTTADSACEGFPVGDIVEIDSSYVQASDGRRVTSQARGTSGVGVTYNGVKNAEMTSNFTATLYDCNVNVSTCDYSFTQSQPK